MSKRIPEEIYNRKPLSRLMHAGVTCFRTDVLGHVIATSDGREVSFIWEKQSAQPEGLELGDGMTYIGNKNSKTFHASYCDSLPSKKNQVELESVKAAMAGLEADGPLLSGKRCHFLCSRIHDPDL